MEKCFQGARKKERAGWKNNNSGCPIKCLPPFFRLLHVKERITWNALGNMRVHFNLLKLRGQMNLLIPP
jgi:hypothetical protein